MKIIHCADVHLDSSLSFMSPDKANKRREELLLAFRRMVEYAEENSVEAVIIAGDLFDKRRPSASSVNFFINLVRSKPSIDFYYIKGNHDGNDLFGAGEVLPDNLFLFGENWNYYSLRNCGQKGRIVICGRDYSNNEVEAPALNIDDFNILVLHGELFNGSSDRGLNELKNRWVDYLALGHIHSYSCRALDGRGMACYPGCLESRGFDECGENGFVVLDIDCDNRTFSVEHINNPVRNMYKLSLDISDCRDNAAIFEKARAYISENVLSTDDMFLLELTGMTDIECNINLHMLEQYFSNNYYLARVHNLTEYGIVFDDYRFDESLKGEFVRLVMLDTSLTDEDKADIVRTGIMALRGEALD